MTTNLVLDSSLLAEAMRIGGHGSERETVTEALQEYIRRRRQREIFELFGNVDYDAAYDYKALRNRD